MVHKQILKQLHGDLQTVIIKTNDFKFDIYDAEVREIVTPNQEDDELISLEEKKKEDKQMINLTSSDINTTTKNEKTDSLSSTDDVTKIKNKETKKSLTSSAVENEALTNKIPSPPTILKNNTKENYDNATVDNVLEIISKDKNSKNDENLIVESDIYLENIDKIGFLRVVGFINSQEFSKDIPLSNITDSTKKLPLKFIADIENDMTEADSADEFFICAYHIKNNNSPGSIDYFDCNEGDIKSKSSSTKLNLFKPSSQIYQTSINYHNTYMNTKNDSYIDDNYGKNSNLDLLNSEEKVKVEIIVPLKDKKDIEKMKVMAMLKGQTQSEIIDVQEELDKIEGSTIKKIFVFDRETDIGKIQIGDRFYACVSGEELRPPEGMECDKRLIKSFEKNNKLIAR